MAISPIERLASSSEGRTASSNNTIDKDEFLLLLVTQLKNQDPLNPMEYAEFTSQTAQFASLEQLQDINKNLGNLQVYQSALFDEHAVSLIGKTVTVDDNRLKVTEGVPEQLNFDLERATSDLYVYIYDENGNLVREIDKSGPFDTGENSLTWDGMDNDGLPVPDGTYSFEVQAVDPDGRTFSGKAFFQAPVTSVNFWNGTAYVIAGEREISLGNVTRVTAGPAVSDESQEVFRRK